MKGKIKIELEYDQRHINLDELTAEVVHQLLTSFPSIFWKVAFCTIEEDKHAQSG